MDNSWVLKELKDSRNAKSAFKTGLHGGLIHNFLSAFVFKGKEPWDIRNKVKDSETLQTKFEADTITYPKHDGKLSFDLLENLSKSGTDHDHDQPSHLKVKENL